MHKRSLHRMQRLGPDRALHARVYNPFPMLILGGTDCCNVPHFMPVKLTSRLLHYSASRLQQTEGIPHLSKSSFCLYICLLREESTWYELPFLRPPAPFSCAVSQSAVMLWDIVFCSHFLCVWVFFPPTITKERLKFNKI